MSRRAPDAVRPVTAQPLGLKQRGTKFGKTCAETRFRRDGLGSTGHTPGAVGLVTCSGIASPMSISNQIGSPGGAENTAGALFVCAFDSS